MTKQVSIAEAKARFAACVKDAESGEEVVITRHGRAVAAMVSLEELNLLRQRAARDQRGSLLELVGLDPEGELVDALEHVLQDRGPVRAVEGMD